MPTDSVPGAVVEYLDGLTVPTHGQVPAFRDQAFASTVGGAVKPPYIVVKADGGQPLRDMEGNVFGPQTLSVTVYADTAQAAREVGEFVRYGGQPPEERAGVEKDNALPLTGYTQVQVWLSPDFPVETTAPSRRADQYQHLYRFRLTVHTQKG